MGSNIKKYKLQYSQKHVSANNYERMQNHARIFVGVIIEKAAATFVIIRR